jgi:hypothetical protein
VWARLKNVPPAAPAKLLILVVWSSSGLLWSSYGLVWSPSGLGLGLIWSSLVADLAIFFLRLRRPCRLFFNGFCLVCSGLRLVWRGPCLVWNGRSNSKKIPAAPAGLIICLGFLQVKIVRPNSRPVGLCQNPRSAGLARGLASIRLAWFCWSPPRLLCEHWCPVYCAPPRGAPGSRLHVDRRRSRCLVTRATCVVCRCRSICALGFDD